MIMTKAEKSLLDDPRAAWAAYQPGPETPWDAARVAHLHRRAGFGATWGQLQRDVREGFEPSMRRILDGEPQGPGGQPAAEFAETVTAMEESARRRPSIERIQLLWLYRLIVTPFPLREVMTLAWHGHYATSQAKVQAPELMLAQHLSQRELCRSPIRQLHRRMLGDGAMRRWLDGFNSTKAQPNENLAREFLELFAIGLGDYTERDVREAARALTGWREPDRLDPGDFDAGPKTILGETGPWGLDDVVRIACRQPAAAVHVARRLYRTFVSDTDEPSPELLAPLADAIRIPGDVDVARGIELVLRSRLFHSEDCRARCVKSPVALAIGAIRALELFRPPPELVDLEIHLTKMGQRLFFPPGVAGWPGGLAWLDGQAVVARANFADWITQPSTSSGMDPFRGLAERHGLQTPEEWLERLATLLLPTPLSPSGRALGVQQSPDRRRLMGGRVRGSPRLHSRERQSADRRRITRQLLSLPEAQVG
ncbi:MAG TPA: DUF1800 family protein [Isosphaeraceae bacterium]|nr:DUF1800 family protein [Isosphaeraceae bacterium]